MLHMLEFLGGNWIKLGQALALRFDLLPPEICRELLTIKNETETANYHVIRQIVTGQLGRPPEELFARFGTHPFAVTSTGQLHEAITRDGDRLVFKIQTAAIRETFKADSRLMRFVAIVFNSLNLLPPGSVRRLVSDFINTRKAEIDFKAAEHNSRRMSALASEDAWEVNARVRPEFTTEQVMAWEFIDGIRVVDLVDAVRTLNEPYLHELSNQGYDLSKIAHHIYRNALNQIFRDGIYHADVSPAGLLVLPNNVIAYVDFVVVGRMTDDRLDNLRYFYGCILENKHDEAIEELLSSITPAPSINQVQLRRDLARVLDDFLDGFESPVGSAPRKAAHQTHLNLMQAFRKHRVVIPHDLSTYLTTMLTIESIVFELCPGFNVVTEQSAFFSRAASLDLTDALGPMRVYESLVEYSQEAQRVFTNLRKLQKSGQMIEISLRTLRIRLMQYGFWSILVSVCTYLGFRDEAIRQFQISVGLKPYWIPATFVFFAILLLSRIWRQGKRLAAVDRSIITSSEISVRSFGRVR
jgi:predicted unusual protein kinase regulating ubiquinone biosynthesis (AarF/ABC1/UbiB family)